MTGRTLSTKSSAVAHRTLAAAVVALAIGMVGCGDEGGQGNGGGQGDDARGATAPDGSATVGGDTVLRPSGEPARAEQRRQERRAGRSTGRLYRAIATADAKQLCGALSPDARSNAGSAESTCAEAFERRLSRLTPRMRKRIDQATVGAMEIDGDRATVTISFMQSYSGLATLVRKDRRWLITSFSLPPEGSAGGR